MLADSVKAHPELTPALKTLLGEAGRLLTGHKRRAFLAQVTDALLGAYGVSP